MWCCVGMTKTPTPIWTQLPEAAALLASCAANPPATRVARYRFNETAEEYSAAKDRRVRQLQHIYRAAEPRTDTPEWTAWLDMDVQRAIREAVAAGALVLEAAE